MGIGELQQQLIRRVIAAVLEQDLREVRENLQKFRPILLQQIERGAGSDSGFCEAEEQGVSV